MLKLPLDLRRFRVGVAKHNTTRFTWTGEYISTTVWKLVTLYRRLNSSFRHKFEPFEPTIYPIMRSMDIHIRQVQLVVVLHRNRIHWFSNLCLAQEAALLTIRRQAGGTWRNFIEISRQEPQHNAK